MTVSVSESLPWSDVSSVGSSVDVLSESGGWGRPAGDGRRGEFKGERMRYRWPEELILYSDRGGGECRVNTRGCGWVVGGGARRMAKVKQSLSGLLTNGTSVCWR